MPDSKWVKHMACPKCNSSDANTLYEDGHSYCFSCKTRFGVDMQEEVKVIPMSNEASPTLKTKGEVSDIPDRHISRATAKKYNVQIQKYGSTITHHIYQYFDKDNNHIANKVRGTQNKKFWSRR